MGATGPVHVEVLIANNSIEEVMIQMKEGQSDESESSSDSNEVRAKVHRLLTGANLIRPSIGRAFKKRKATGDDQEQKHRNRVRFQE